MGLSSTFKHALGLSFLPRRTNPSAWKGKSVDRSSVKVNCSTVQCNCDFHSSESDMAVNGSELDLHHGGIGDSSSSRAVLVRIVSWSSILGHRCRWTMEQERDLAIAEQELARCQNAWSSEQEVWLTYIKALTEEKEAHEEFLHRRAKHQDDEQQHFRKSWNHRRSQDRSRQLLLLNPRRGSSRLRRLRIGSSFGQGDVEW
ncbi:uncharacterized protein ATNIH1004_007855 [Aspergillus tanneri]|uniref:Uncharacterized protein n=1 Tax=Aspergillus tanneri TaxID=1220188 RepID=A0A5M9MHF7_9EURO|nr:uncharacterized protein ATNIH1004_007855 [Aspergillus tanneri]KAA8646425.1 hypothetical protein ATNIH1004_007855 [Aspergillus tanneri]